MQATVIASELRTALIFALKHSSQEAAREHVCGVFFEVSGKTLFAVGTDGHRMAVVECEATGSTDGSCLVSRDYAEGMIKALKKLPSLEPIRLEVNGPARGDSLTTTIGKSETKTPTIDASYPPWRQVMPTTQGAPRDLFGFDCAYLADAASASKSAGIGTRFHFEFSGDDVYGPTVLTPINKSNSIVRGIRVVIMGLAVSKKEATLTPRSETKVKAKAS